METGWARKVAALYSLAFLEGITSFRGVVGSDPSPPISEKEQAEWHAGLCHFHKAAGHPTNRNLARVLRAPGKEPWKIDARVKFRCSACEAVRPGGSSSKQVPPAALTDLPKAWQVLLKDVGERSIWTHHIKCKVLMMMDAATKYKVVVPLLTYGLNEQKNETTQQIIALGCSEAQAYGDLRGLCLDYDLGCLSRVLQSDQCVVESARFEGAQAWLNWPSKRSRMRRRRFTWMMTLCPPLPVWHWLQLHSTKPRPSRASVRSITDEDQVTLSQLQSEHAMAEFPKLLAKRADAESIARKVRAATALTRLKNSNSRQPIREYKPSELVKVWRKYLPHTAHKGHRGGFQKSIKPQWIGPGRVLFQETLLHQTGEDRKLGGRCHPI